MAGGREYSSYQRKVINRYYDNHDTIISTRLAELVTEIALAEGNTKKLNSLWKRAEQALSKSGLKPESFAKVLETRDTQALAKLVSKL